MKFLLILLVLLTPWSGPLDLFVSHLFFTDGHFASSSFFDFMFNYGFFPAWIVIGIALLGLFFKKWQKEALYLMLVLAIGSGLIIHAGLKDHWGRPRPKQVIEFGGSQPFRTYYQPNFVHQPEPSKSFPCGHCSMGFYFFALALLAKRRGYRVLYMGTMTLAWVLGGLLSLVRIAQGGHFLTDAIFSALIMWWTALGLFHLIFEVPSERLNTKAT